MKRIHHILLISLLAFFGCTKDNPRPDASAEGEVAISLSLSRDALSSRGFAQMAAQEEEIRELNVLIFHGDELYAVETFLNLSTDVVFKTNITDDPVTLWVFANCYPAIRSLSPEKGWTRDEIRRSLTAAYTAEGMDRDLFPMWGTYEFPTGISEADAVTPITVTLLRALARVDVAVAPQLQYDFKVLSIRVFQANDLVQIVPNETIDPDDPPGHSSECTGRRRSRGDVPGSI